MIKGIGRIIYHIREDLDISQKELTRGLCSGSTLSRLEWEEQNIGKWLIDAFLQRLGKSQDNFWAIVHAKDYAAMEQRRITWNSILCGRYEEARKQLKEYEKVADMSESFHRQFVLYCKGLMKGNEEQDWAAAAELFTQSISQTVPRFTLECVDNVLIGREEMLVLVMLARAYDRAGEAETARSLLRSLLYNIGEKVWEEEELAKIYPKVARAYIEVLKRENRYEGVIEFAEKALKLLVKNGIIYLMAELMECIIWGMNQRIQAEERRFTISERLEHMQLKKHVETLHEIWAEYGDILPENMMYATNIQKDVGISNEIIRKSRKLCKMSQERLSENICTVEHLSRIEIGKSAPVDKNYRGLMEKMNQAQDRNLFFLNAEEYELYGKMREVERLVAGDEYRKAAILWEKVREEIPNISLKNQQNIIQYDALIKQGNKEITQAEAIEEYERALRLTIPEFPNVDLTKWPLDRKEVVLLNNIATEYYSMGRKKEARMIYDDLWQAAVESDINILYRISEFKMTIYNMGMIELLDKNWEKAKKLFQQGIDFALESGKFAIAANCLFALGWGLKTLDDSEENDEKARHILKQAFYISNILESSVLASEISSSYEELWNEEIEY